MHLASRIPSGRRQQQGLALIEVLFALGLSSVMFLALFTAQTHSQKVLVYSQQLHHANRLLSQIAKHTWAYPHHYQGLAVQSEQGDQSCLTGSYCSPQKMTQAWAAHWQSQISQQLPNGELSLYCAHGCVPGSVVSVRLQWPQKLALASGRCLKGVACMQIKIAL